MKNNYQIIYADPPWAYRDKARAGARGASFKYPTQSLAWLGDLPISNITAKDCALFIWVTMPQLDKVFDIITKWGFTYKTVAFTWVKRNKKSKNSWFWGMGSWTRSNTELCLIATKGSPKRINAGIHSIIETPIEAHSKKPDEVRTKIVELLGDLPRIELFARQQVDGWDSIGFDIDGQDIKTILQEGAQHE